MISAETDWIQMKTETKNEHRIHHKQNPIRSVVTDCIENKISLCGIECYVKTQICVPNSFDETNQSMYNDSVILALNVN